MRCPIKKREKDKLSKRRRRARLYAAGLTAQGKPRVVPVEMLPEESRPQYADHPQACQCYDCLWGPDEYEPRRGRLHATGRKELAS